MIIPEIKVIVYFLSTITTAVFRRERQTPFQHNLFEYSKDYALSSLHSC